jgi:alkyl hydroperoxide reductase subunit AhpC
MKRYILAIAIIAMTIVGCQSAKEKGSETKASNIVCSIADGDVASIALERFADDLNSVESIENLEVVGGKELTFSLDIAKDAPAKYYQLNLGDGHTPIKLIVEAGDNIEVNIESVDGLYTKYSVEGSEESKLLAEFNDIYFANVNRFIETYEVEPSKSGAIARGPIQAQVGFVTKYADRLAAIYALRESYYGVQGINIIHVRTVRDALSQSYPTSPYIEVLNREIEFDEMLRNAKQTSYFDITLTDVNRKPHSLTDFKGKVTVLCFWSAYEPFSTPLIAEFKEIYNRYHDKGLEAYFVSADQSRIRWIEMVQKQQHPWTSVYGGDDPLVFTSYNIQVVPYAFIIDREGTMQYAPLVPKELEALIKKLL